MGRAQRSARTASRSVLDLVARSRSAVLDPSSSFPGLSLWLSRGSVLCFGSWVFASCLGDGAALVSSPRLLRHPRRWEGFVRLLPRPLGGVFLTRRTSRAAALFCITAKSTKTKNSDRPPDVHSQQRMVSIALLILTFTEEVMQKSESSFDCSPTYYSASCGCFEQPISRPGESTDM